MNKKPSRPFEIHIEGLKNAAIRLNDRDKPRGVLAEIYEHNIAVRRKEKEKAMMKRGEYITVKEV